MWPPGGIRLRIRHPSKKLSSVAVGGKSWPSFNATEETVVFAAAPADTAALQHIVATFA